MLEAALRVATALGFRKSGLYTMPITVAEDIHGKLKPVLQIEYPLPFIPLNGDPGYFSCITVTVTDEFTYVQWILH